MPALNKIPQAGNLQLYYEGDLAPNKWVSFIDASLNAYNPCLVYDDPVPGQHSGRMDDNTHSGVMQDVSGDKLFEFIQYNKLDETKIYAVCYAVVDGSQVDSSWKDSYLRFRISTLFQLSSHSITHVTEGMIPNLFDLSLTYGGTIPNNKWVSFVDATLNGGYPCQDYATATHIADASHSGPIQAGVNDKILVFNTLSMSVDTLFAVCYSDGPGDGSGPQLPHPFTHTPVTYHTGWRDSALRIRIAKLTMTKYGIFDPRYMKSSNIIAATSRFPQIENAQLSYIGELPTGKWISLIKASENSFNP
jgi:hypothetical protein